MAQFEAGQRVYTVVVESLRRELPRRVNSPAVQPTSARWHTSQLCDDVGVGVSHRVWRYGIYHLFHRLTVLFEGWPHLMTILLCGVSSRPSFFSTSCHFLQSWVLHSRALVDVIKPPSSILPLLSFVLRPTLSRKFTSKLFSWNFCWRCKNGRWCSSMFEKRSFGRRRDVFNARLLLNRAGR